jgi:hypothetical protein
MIRIICVFFSIYYINTSYCQTSENSFNLNTLKESLNKVATKNKDFFSDSFFDNNFFDNGREFKFINYINLEIFKNNIPDKCMMIFYTSNGEVLTHHLFFINLQNYNTCHLILEYHELKLSENNLKIKASKLEKYFITHRFVDNKGPKLYSNSYMVLYKNNNKMNIKLLSDRDIYNFLSK